MNDGMNRRWSTGERAGVATRAIRCRPVAGKPVVKLAVVLAGVLVVGLGLGLRATPGFSAQGAHGQGASAPAQAGARDSGSSRHLQVRADPPPPPASAQPFGYPGVPAGGTRRVIIVNPQPPAQAVQQPAAQLSREAPDPRELSNRSLRADTPPPAQPFGYPPANAGRVIIIAPAPTQSFAGSGTALPDR